MISICAVIAARNEAPYLRVLLPLLAGQGIDAALIDNGSTDGSLDLYSEYAGRPVVHLEHLPYHGSFSLSDQLDAKKHLCTALKHDWIIHHDADEIMENRQSGLTLRDAIQDADDAGFTALNFEEFTFLPDPGSDHTDGSHYQRILRYYFFEPSGNRLNRAWRRTAQLDHVLSGGHQLSGAQLRMAPVNHVLRHYIVLGYQHAREKYLTRAFSAQDLARGWHGNRLQFTAENLRLPEDAPCLFRLDEYRSREFRRDVPSSTHYWEWATARPPAERTVES